METKTCKTCGALKLTKEFDKDNKSKDGLRYSCKDCRRKEKSLWACKKYQKEKGKVKICKVCRKEKTYCEFSKDKSRKDGLRYECKVCQKEVSKRYIQNNKIKISIARKINIEKHPERFREYRRKSVYKRVKNDILFKIKSRVAYSIRKVLRKNNLYKNKRTVEILGCSIEDFKIYIEKQFEPWMNWDNYGRKQTKSVKPNISWDFDHIVPLSYAKTIEDVIKLNHYSNLQPLDSYVNQVIKRDKLNWMPGRSSLS